MIEEIREYFSQCPLFKDGKINVNYLGEDFGYTIDAVPSPGVIRRYVDGGTLRQYVFIIASREPYEKNVLLNMQTARFYEELEAWVGEQNALNHLPELKDPGCAARGIECVASGYAFDMSRAGWARYQIQLRLKYYKEAV